MQAGESQALFTAMGCPCEVRLFATDNDLSQQVLRQCHGEALRFQNKYSRYRDDSIVSKINHSAGQSPVTIDPETSAIMQYSSVCYVQSNGLFDITSGVLRQIWNMDTQTLPRQSEIDNCLETIGWDKVELETDIIFLPGPVAVWAFAVIGGMSWLATVPLTAALTADVYGVRNLGTLFGLANMSHAIGGALAISAFGWAFTNWGSDNIPFVVGAITLLAAGIVSLSIREKTNSVRFVRVAQADELESRSHPAGAS